MIKGLIDARALCASCAYLPPGFVFEEPLRGLHGLSGVSKRVAAGRGPLCVAGRPLQRWVCEMYLREPGSDDSCPATRVHDI